MRSHTFKIGRVLNQNKIPKTSTLRISYKPNKLPKQTKQIKQTDFRTILRDTSYCRIGMVTGALIGAGTGTYTVLQEDNSKLSIANGIMCGITGGIVGGINGCILGFIADIFPFVVPLAAIGGTTVAMHNVYKKYNEPITTK